ncbi:hypothetical protein GGD41_003042 [Paraburkholderia bryophila]|uniref:DUF2844 domain-containing protein n=3 Tax=Burkholderiaceae TaxID=119060 RepID=A0A7Z0AZM5_9BURK|nr:DUF2844 domain-containing protein [Paraburkholderia bryophila]NYH15814.1 hypothetical protein [Paraburkholderia bryophila]NYH25747.1 hypothetical protein [Paraburkholderia bryophila]
MMTSKFGIAVVAAASFVAAAPAYAALGSAPTYPVTASSTSAGAASPGGAAVARFAANASANAATPAYTVSQTTLPSGTVVNEYVTAGNTVFALSWQGPTMPPLKTLLATYFPTYVQALTDAHNTQGGGYGAAVVRQTGLVVETGGHMGSFVGRAYLPQALPQGLSADDIK